MISIYKTNPSQKKKKKKKKKKKTTKKKKKQKPNKKKKKIKKNTQSRLVLRVYFKGMKTQKTMQFYLILILKD